jgi:hypothetical protein
MVRWLDEDQLELAAPPASLGRGASQWYVSRGAQTQQQYIYGTASTGLSVVRCGTDGPIALCAIFS